MKVIEQHSKTKKYKCPECKSILEIDDSDFSVTKEYPTFHLMGLSDFIRDNRIKIRVCDCPVCGATIRKEYNVFVKEADNL